MTENNLCFTRDTVNPADVEVEVSRQRGLRTASLTRTKLRLRDLIGTHRVIDATSEPEIDRAKLDGDAVVFGTFASDIRKQENLRRVSAVGLDFDKVDDATAAAVRERLANFGAAFVWYTTLSHRLVRGLNSFRVVLLLNGPASRPEFRHLASAVYSAFPESDVQARDATRVWLLPAVTADRAENAELVFHAGFAIDVASTAALVGDALKARLRQPPARTSDERIRQRLGFGVEDVRAMLRVIPADCDRALWMKIGFALADWGGPEAADLWAEWSADGGSQYAGHAETMRVWTQEVMRRAGSQDVQHRFDIGALAKLARENGWRRGGIILGSSGQRPIISLADEAGERNAADVGADALKVLGARRDCFWFNDRLSQIQTDESGPPRAVTLSAAAATGLLCESADWQTLTKGGMRNVARPPKGHVETWLAMVERRPTVDGVRILRAIATAPYLSSDGQIHETPGYEAATQIFLGEHDLLINLLIPEGLEEQRQAAAEAAERVLAHFAEVPFETPVHRAAFLALLLTLIARPLLGFSPTPMFLVNANMSGAGKTRLVQSAVMIATGRMGILSTLPVQEEERQKVILSEADIGAVVVIFDNVNGKLGGPSLESAITQGGARGRRLGSTAMVSVRFAPCWIATANNASLSTDMVSRTIEINLTTPHTEPRQHNFQIDESDWWSRHLPAARPQIISDLLLILRVHQLAGHPLVQPTMGSFGEWHRIAASAVGYATGFSIADTQQRLRETADDDTPDLRALLSAWPSGASFLARDLVHSGSAAKAGGIDGSEPTDDAVTFADALEPYRGPMSQPATLKRLTQQLKRHAAQRVLLPETGLVAWLVVQRDNKGRALFSVKHEEASIDSAVVVSESSDNPA